MSPYFAASIVSVREALQLIKKHNANSADFSSSYAAKGVYSCVREIVFREIYRQTMVDTHHTGMNLPQNLKFDFVEWEDDGEGYQGCEPSSIVFNPVSQAKKNDLDGDYIRKWIPEPKDVCERQIHL